MSDLFGLWGTSSESVTRLGHRLLLEIVWIQHQKPIPCLHPRLCWIHCARFSKHCAALIIYIGLNWSVEQEDNCAMTGKVFWERSGQSVPWLEQEAPLLFFSLPPRAMQAQKFHLQTSTSLTFLALVLDTGKSWVESTSHSWYLEEPYHWCLELGRDLANPELWRGWVSSEGMVNREGGRERTFCSHFPSHSFPGEIATLLTPERMTCGEGPAVPTSTAF